MCNLQIDGSCWKTPGQFLHAYPAHIGGLSMISAKQLSSLLAALYAAPMEDTNWQVFLNALCGQIQAQQGLFLATNVKDGAAEILAQGGMAYNPEMQRLYNEYYGQIDPYRVAFQRNPRVGPIAGEELVAPAEVEKTEFYNDLVVPTGARHAMVLPAVLTRTAAEAISVWRSPRQRPFGESSVKLFELLLPHIQAALKTRRIVELSNIRAGTLQAALDSSTTAILILNAAGRVVHYNQNAERVLRLQDGISMKEGKLRAWDSGAQAELQSLVTSAAIVSGASVSQPGGVIALPRRSGGRSFNAVVLPLRMPGSLDAAHVLILITDPQAAVSLPESFMKTLYGLTQSEAEIANGLLSGLSVEEVAELRQVTTGTLRMQLKTIFQKTGARRQSELIRLLLCLPRSDSPAN